MSEVLNSVRHGSEVHLWFELFSKQVLAPPFIRFNVYISQVTKAIYINLICWEHFPQALHHMVIKWVK